MATLPSKRARSSQGEQSLNKRHRSHNFRSHIQPSRPFDRAEVQVLSDEEDRYSDDQSVVEEYWDLYGNSGDAYPPGHVELHLQPQLDHRQTATSSRPFSMNSAQMLSRGSESSADYYSANSQYQNSSGSECHSQASRARATRESSSQQRPRRLQQSMHRAPRKLGSPIWSTVKAEPVSPHLQKRGYDHSTRKIADSELQSHRFNNSYTTRELPTTTMENTESLLPGYRSTRQHSGRSEPEHKSQQLSVPFSQAEGDRAEDYRESGPAYEEACHRPVAVGKGTSSRAEYHQDSKHPNREAHINYNPGGRSVSSRSDTNARPQDWQDWNMAPNAMSSISHHPELVDRAPVFIDTHCKDALTPHRRHDPHLSLDIGSSGSEESAILEKIFHKGRKLQRIQPGNLKSPFTATYHLPQHGISYNERPKRQYVDLTTYSMSSPETLVDRAPQYDLMPVESYTRTSNQSSSGIEKKPRSDLESQKFNYPEAAKKLRQSSHTQSTVTHQPKRDNAKLEHRVRHETPERVISKNPRREQAKSAVLDDIAPKENGRAKLLNASMAAIPPVVTLESGPRDQTTSLDKSGIQKADGRALTKSDDTQYGPQIIASQPTRKTFQEERQAWEALEKAKEDAERMKACRDKIHARYHTVPPEQVAKAAQKKRAPRSRSKKQPNDRAKFAESNDESFLERPAAFSKSNNLNDSFSHSLPKEILPQTSKFSSQVKMVKEVEEENALKQAKIRKFEKTSASDEARFLRETEPKRLRHRQRLLDDAAREGYTVGDEELEVRVASFMKTRQEKRQKHVARKLRSFQAEIGIVSPKYRSETQAIIGHQAPTAAMGVPGVVSGNESRPPVVVNTTENAASPKNDPPVQSRVIKSDVSRRFAKAQLPYRPEPDSDTESEVSEEDPDDEPAVNSTLASKNAPQEMKDNDAMADGDSGGLQDQVNPVSSQTRDRKANEPEPESLIASLEHDLHEKMSQSSSPTAEETSSPISSHPILTSGGNCGGREHVKIYKVVKRLTCPGEDDEIKANKVVLGKFTDIEDAIAFAQKTLQGIRQEANKPRNIDQFSTHDSFQATISYDDENQISVITVEGETNMSEEVAVDLAQVKQRIPAKSWMIIFSVKTETFDDEDSSQIVFDGEAGGDATIEKPKMKYTKYIEEVLPSPHHYSEIKMANHAAFQYLYEKLKPTKTIDRPKWTNEVGHEMRRIRDSRDAEGLDFSIDVNGNDCPWLSKQGIVTMGIEVRQYEIQGPLN